MDQLLDMETLKKLTLEQQEQVIAGVKQQAFTENAQNLEIAKLRARRNEIRAYIIRLQEEKDKWDQMMENYKQRCQKAIDLADQSIEPPTSRKALSELMETETIQSPRYVLNKVLKKFNSQSKSLETQKIIDEMESKVKLAMETLCKKKRDIQTVTEFVNSESLSELEKQKEVWKSIKECEERRAINLKAKLERKGNYRKCHYSCLTDDASMMMILQNR